MVSARSLLAILAVVGSGLWFTVGGGNPRKEDVTIRRTVNAAGAVMNEIPVDSKGQSHGTERYFYPDGTLQAEVDYYHGVLQGEASYWPDGRLRKRIVKGYFSDSREEFDEHGNPIKR